MGLNIEELRKVMVKRWGYQEEQVDGVIEKMMVMDPDILLAFQKSLNSGILPDEPIYSGFSPKSLSEAYSLKPPAIFMLLDWIRREPQEALEALVDEFKKPLPKNFKPF